MNIQFFQRLCSPGGWPVRGSVRPGRRLRRRHSGWRGGARHGAATAPLCRHDPYPHLCRGARTVRSHCGHLPVHSQGEQVNTRRRKSRVQFGTIMKKKTKNGVKTATTIRYFGVRGGQGGGGYHIPRLTKYTTSHPAGQKKKHTRGSRICCHAFFRQTTRHALIKKNSLIDDISSRSASILFVLLVTLQTVRI